ncbi:envelope stress response membrane protein PspC [uncultured Vibrio sp.]|uniref:envelope stress response membrane protein PspC n=1 Tax=uncultured Vibrio sp. TaxID=114054 RepID=UPI0025E929F7|nr:envelope stress response membrane protein PspC [uncultured Vibrio sp.]
MTKKELFRDTQNSKLTGVCAGLANYFSVEVWLVRILVISAALLGGSFLVILAYVAMTLMLEKQPLDYSENIKSQQDHKLKSKPWQQGKNATELLKTLETDFATMGSKLEKMEAYVTSETFKVNREFKNL